MPYRFCLTAKKSPTYRNLCQYLPEQGWKSTRFAWRADCSEQHFQFPAAIAEQLEFKHLLSELVAAYCPGIMPETYVINDYNWPQVLTDLVEKAPADRIWILKPALLNNGQYIHIFQSVTQIERHFLSAKRMGGEQVLQAYVNKPHLLQGPAKGHKYSIRMFVVLTNYAGAFLYPKGYFNIALKPYEGDDFSDLRMHLTNEHLFDDQYNVVQVPTEQYPFFQDFYPRIKNNLTQLMQGLGSKYPEIFQGKKEPRLALFGFDFMVDSDLGLWLLEANHAPCFPVTDEHPLQKKLYYPFWQAFISEFLLPMAEKKEGILSAFESLGHRSFSRGEGHSTVGG